MRKQFLFVGHSNRFEKNRAVAGVGAYRSRDHWSLPVGNGTAPGYGSAAAEYEILNLLITLLLPKGTVPDQEIPAPP